MQPLILIVEDDPTLRILGAKQCGLLGLRFEIAGTGSEAVKMWESSNSYDLILMDLGMPDMSGVEATSHIRERELKQGRQRVPIIAMTAYAERDQALAAGMDDYIQKPVLLAPLSKLVSKWVPNFEASV